MPIRLRQMLTVLVVVLALAVLASVAHAGIMLESGNAAAVVNTDDVAGLTSWTVGGTEYLGRQWFWYRLGTSGGEHPLDDLSLMMHVAADLDGDGRDEALALSYAGGGLQVDLTYILSGGDDAGSASLSETVRLRNTGTETLDVHFFQFADFNLGGDADNDTVHIGGGNTAEQSDGLFLSEVSVAPAADHFQADAAANLLALLGDGAPTTLDDAPGPVTGDVASAFQWDADLAPGDSLVLSENKHVVPEPATLLLLVGGSAALLRRRSRRR